MAVLMAQRIREKADFAEELLDQVYLEEDISSWIEDALKS